MIDLWIVSTMADYEWTPAGAVLTSPEAATGTVQALLANSAYDVVRVDHWAWSAAGHYARVMSNDYERPRPETRDEGCALPSEDREVFTRGDDGMFRRTR